MPKTIFDYVNAPVIAAYVNELGSNQIPYLGELLFPAKKKVGIDLKWVVRLLRPKRWTVTAAYLLILG